MGTSNFEFLKGNIEIIILNSLYGGDKYGYEIAKAIKEKTANAYEIKQPTLYAYLKRLEQNSLIESYWGEESSGGRRKYFRLTQEGRSASVQFTSEWKYQQSVINSLVPDDDTIQPITQNDATPLFGNKTHKQRKPRVMQSVDEQTAISEKLEKLLNSSLSNKPEKEESVEVEIALQKEELVDVEVTPQSDEIIISNLPTDEEVTDNASTDEAQPIAPVSDQLPYERPVPPKREYTYEPPVSQEEFLRTFNNKAQEIIEKTAAESYNTDQEDSYKHVFDKLLKNQLDDDALRTDSPAKPSESTVTNNAPLEVVAEKLFEQGVKVRLYNSDTAKYVPEPVLYVNKINCATAWLTYFTFAVESALCWVLYQASFNMTVLVSALLIACVFPAIFTALYFSNKTKKAKPKFDFKYHIVNTLIAAGLLIILIFSLNILLFKIVFSDTAAVLHQIVLPIIISINIPMYIVYYKAIYKKMLG